MSDFFFLFDLDATITKQEILPELARNVDCFEDMKLLTEETMLGRLPFHTSFLKRVELLKNIPVSVINKQVADIELNEKIVEFLKENKERCYIITGNLDCWISTLIDKLSMTGKCFSSIAEVDNDVLVNVKYVIDKHKAVKEIHSKYHHLVAVGDGNNDAEMIDVAQVGIGFGAIRPIAPAVMDKAQYAVYEEDKLCQFLKRLL